MSLWLLVWCWKVQQHNYSLCCCVFWPAFGCCAHPKAGPNTFFSLFQPFLFIFHLFQWFHAWNQQKTSEKKKKHSLVHFQTDFCWFQAWNHWKRFKISKKGWKRLKKSISTSFQVRAAPESWPKYTTLCCVALKINILLQMIFRTVSVFFQQSGKLIDQ